MMQGYTATVHTGLSRKAQSKRYEQKRRRAARKRRFLFLFLLLLVAITSFNLPLGVFSPAPERAGRMHLPISNIIRTLK